MIADSSMENIFRELRDKTATADELAACLRAAMWAIESGSADAGIVWPAGIITLITRCQKALKEYDK